MIREKVLSDAVLQHLGWSLESRNLSHSILERVASGDSNAVEECVDAYGGLIWSIASRMCPTAADAEDATQDIFVEIWQKANTFNRLKSSEATFITLIARRRLIDRQRRSSAGFAVQSVVLDMEIADDTLRDTVELAEEAEKALNCIRKLSKPQQQVITLSFQHGIPHSGIAERLSLPVGTVKSFARRALIQIRDCMNRTEMAPSSGVVT